MNVDLPDWAECLFDESLRYIGLRGGRGSAKSRSIASALVIRGKDKPLRILCGREIQKSIKDSVKRLLDDSIKRCGLEDHYESTDTEIRGKNGTLFIFSGLRSNIDSVKSLKEKHVAVDRKLQQVGVKLMDLDRAKDSFENVKKEALRDELVQNSIDFVEELMGMLKPMVNESVYKVLKAKYLLIKSKHELRMN